MKLSFMPKTFLGKWSVGLIVFFFLTLFLFYLMCASGHRGGAGFFSNLYLAIPALFMGIFGVAAFSTGIVSITRKNDYSILVFLSTTVGFFVLFWCSAEILFPH